MKKHIALLLVATLALTAMLGLAPIASAEAESPAAATVPEIFVNVAVTANVEFHIAVPAEDYTEDLSILVWQDASASGLYSADDDNVEALKFNGIDEENGLAVFTYKRIGAAEMFKNIYIRALIEDESGNRTYGDVIDYSIAEWAHYHLTDAGSPLTEAKKDMVAAMIDYGHFASIYADSADKTPAAADLVDYKKVSVTAKLNGYALFTQTTQLVKPGEAVALRAPHVDGATIKAWSGDGVADGKITTSENATVVADYTANAYYFDGDAIGTDWAYDSVNGFTGTYDKVTYANNAITIKYPHAAASSMYYITTQGRNPAGSADGRVKQITGANRYFAFKPTTDANGNKALSLTWISGQTTPNSVTTYPDFFSPAGIGDTVAPVINFTFEVASVNGIFGNSTFAHRLNLRTQDGKYTSSNGNISNTLFKIVDGELILMTDNANASAAKFALTNDNVLHKYAVSLAMVGEGQYMLYAYAENEQTGKMELQASTAFTPTMVADGANYGLNNYIDYFTVTKGANGMAASASQYFNWSTAGTTGWYAGLDATHAAQNGYNAETQDFDAAMLAAYAESRSSFLFGSLYYCVGNIYN